MNHVATNRMFLNDTYKEVTDTIPEYSDVHILISFIRETNMSIPNAVIENMF